MAKSQSHSNKEDNFTRNASICATDGSVCLSEIFLVRSIFAIIKLNIQHALETRTFLGPNASLHPLSLIQGDILNLP